MPLVGRTPYQALKDEICINGNCCLDADDNVFVLRLSYPKTVSCSESLDKEIIKLLRTPEVLTFVVKMLEFSGENKIVCNEETYCLLKLHSCKKSETSVESFKLKLKIDQESRDYFIDAEFDVLRFELSTKIVNNIKCFEINVTIRDINTHNSVAVYFGLISVCMMCENVQLLMSNADDSKSGTTNIFTCILLAPIVYKDNDKYINGIKEYAVDIVNDLVNGKSKLEEQKQELLLIGMIPKSLERLRHYLEEDNGRLIAKESIHVSAATCNTAEIYHNKGRISYDILFCLLIISLPLTYLRPYLYHILPF